MKIGQLSLTAPKGFLNVTEDVRIEKKMKRKYPGLPKTFYRGYKELAEQDFFGIEGTDINKMNIADRGIYISRLVAL